MISSCVISVGIADVRHDPDPASELVTQALMNVAATPGKISGRWTQVLLHDYKGWVRSDELAEPISNGFTRIGEHCATPLGLIAVVNVTHTPLYAHETGHEPRDTAYLSTVLPLLDTTRADRVQVALPGEQTGWLARQTVAIRQRETPYPFTSVSTTTGYARAFLGVPYLWGGVSWEGIDCSGFVQLCYRMSGYTLPRDADQQHDSQPYKVKLEEMQEGDLIFFGGKSITHVALALNQKEFIHAEGQEYNHVTINSFDTADAHYNQRLADIVYGLKRVVV